MALTLAVFEDSHLIYWDQGSIAEMSEMFDEFYNESKDTWQEDKQRGVTTGFTIWKGDKIAKRS